jgi:hypothetical protein
MSSTRNADGVAVADQCRRDSPLNQRRSTVTCRHSRINFWLNCVWLDKKNWRESLIIMINVWRSFLFLLDFLFHLTQCNSGNCVNSTWLIVFFTLARFATGSCLWLWQNVSLDVPISWFRWALPFFRVGVFPTFPFVGIQSSVGWPHFSPCYLTFLYQMEIYTCHPFKCLFFSIKKRIKTWRDV